MDKLIYQNKTVFLALVLLGQVGSLTAYVRGHSAGELVSGEEFDFIVAGGGLGGCVVAARLAESGDYSVLLIEAGGLAPPEIYVPALSLGQQNNPDVRRLYTTISMPGAALARDGRIDYIRGNLLGGSTNVNGMIFNRGSPHDFNNWAKLTGDDSWNYENLLHYLIKHENYTGTWTYQRGLNGPVTISRPTWVPGRNEWLQAGSELGYPTAEPNGPQIISFTPLDFTKKRGRRVTAYTSYIEPFLQGAPQLPVSSLQAPRRGNLVILTHTEVTRVLFEGTRAVGVRFVSNNQTHTARAKKEVIVSTGAIHSPQLLMKSGVGPRSVLDPAHIQPVRYHEAMGKGLHDHPLVSLVVAFSNPNVTYVPERDLTPRAWREFLETGEGPYTTFTGDNAQAFMLSSEIPPEERKLGWADIQLVPHFGNVRSGNWERDQLSDVREGEEIHTPWTIYTARPRSRGSVTLNPRDVDGNPVIDFAYFKDPYDIRVMVDALKKTAQICEETRAFQRVGCRVVRVSLPVCDRLKYRSDAYWECFARYLTRFGYHAVGSCPMGRGPKDPDACVDSKLKVIGIEGLRVVDASVMPAVTNSNTECPVYAIAEKAADMIKEDWGEQHGHGHGSSSSFNFNKGRFPTLIDSHVNYH